MTRDEWLSSTDPIRMLMEPMFGYGAKVVQRISERRLRLWACALCRHPLVWPKFTDPRSRRAVEVAERYADGEVAESELAVAFELAPAAGYELYLSYDYTDLAWVCCNMRGSCVGILQFFDAVFRPRDIDPMAADLLREVAGDPWWPAGLPKRVQDDGSGDVWVDYPVLTPTVVSLAQAAYEERRDDGTLDPARLCILADALEEAGCTDEPLLRHLRSAGPHMRGCHVVDAILGRS